MESQDNQNRAPELRERIVRLIRSNERASKQPVTDEELQKLRTAASRLDQILESAANADQQALQNAAARLDQLLADIRTGKDVAPMLRRRGSRTDPGE